MGVPKLKPRITPEGYIESEQTSNVRHEYLDGEIYEMAGASDRHHRISANLFKMLDDWLGATDCEAFMAEMKLKIDEKTYYYPDVFVACDQPPESPYYCREPVLVVEVVSPSTRQIDHREKLTAYRNIPTLKEYVIIEQDKMQVEIHRRQPDGSWLTSFYTDTEREYDFDFASVRVLMNIDAIYSRVRFGAAEESTPQV